MQFQLRNRIVTALMLTLLASNYVFVQENAKSEKCYAVRQRSAIGGGCSGRAAADHIKGSAGHRAGDSQHRRGGPAALGCSAAGSERFSVEDR